MNILKDIVTFAWRGNGKYVWISCAVLTLIGDLVRWAPLFGVIAQLLISGYFCAIYYHLIQSTATGGREAPEFPDVSNLLGDILWPVLQIFIVFLVSFSPLIAYTIWLSDSLSNPLIEFALLCLGLIYFPMAILAVVILGYTGAMGPRIVIPSLFRVGWIYWLGVLLYLSLYWLSGFVEETSAGYGILQNVLLAVTSSYVLMTNARILGVVYRERQEELGWL